MHLPVRRWLASLALPDSPPGPEVTGLRLLEFTDVAGEPDHLLHPPPHRYRWHCGECGRFVPFGTVRHIPHWEYGYGSEQDDLGICKIHGEVRITWGQQ